MQIPENIQSLIQKYLKGEANEIERKLVDDWYSSFSDENVELPFEQEMQLEEREQKIRSRILQTITDKKKIRNGNKWWLKAAASVLIILIGAAVFINVNKEKEVVFAPKNDAPPSLIIPGGNRALLTLADGSTIILDSAANGIISNQGHIRVTKLYNGQLVYSINGKQVSENDEAFYNTISTPRGGQYQVKLSDGTDVWLNASSSIRFPIIFSGHERKVSITGEAYFEVVKNKKMPFKVHAGSTNIEVLGTHFNVNAYDDEPNAKTTLLEGLVKISVQNNEEDGQLLQPGQQAVINKTGGLRVFKNADLEEAVAWKNGRFQFKSADLNAILRQISRWYDAEIKYKGKADLHFTGKIARNEDVRKVLETIAMTEEVSFKVDGKVIYVSSKEQ